MKNETLPPERVAERVSTGGLRLGGALWVTAGVICAGLFIVVFVGENLLAQNPGLSALVLGGAFAALLTGGLLLARPDLAIVRWSTVVGLVWLLAFGSLMIPALNSPDPDPDPLLSLGLITGFGAAGALVTFQAGRSGRRLE